MDENEELDLNKCDDNLEGDNFDFEVSLKCNNKYMYMIYRYWYCRDFVFIWRVLFFYWIDLIFDKKFYFLIWEFLVIIFIRFVILVFSRLFYSYSFSFRDFFLFY